MPNRAPLTWILANYPLVLAAILELQLLYNSTVLLQNCAPGYDATRVRSNRHAKVDRLDRGEAMQVLLMQVQLILCAFQKLTAFKTKMMVKRMPVANARIRAACRPS